LLSNDTNFAMSNQLDVNRALPRIYCIGEAIIDFSGEGHAGLENTVTFRRMLGGAPANVAIGLSRLGIPVGFVGAVGDEPFGESIRRELAENAVDTEGVCSKHGVNTRLAFVSVDEHGGREFRFWESEGADVRLTPRDINWRRLECAHAVHLSSFLLLNTAMYDLFLRIARWARIQNIQRSFDPNLRLDLWSSADVARARMLEAVSACSIVRCNLDEARFLTGERDAERAARLFAEMGPSLVVVTDGENGCLAHTKTVTLKLGGYSVQAVDTTACGDGFMAGLLSGIDEVRRDPGTLSAGELERICVRANAVGALVATKRGAAASMPAAADVEQFLLSRT
jgi:fructokinase